MAGTLGHFTCGRQLTWLSRMVEAIRAILRPIFSRSTNNAGVSSASLGMPTALTYGNITHSRTEMGQA